MQEETAVDDHLQLKRPWSDEQIAALVDDRPQEGVFRVSRAAVREQAVFDLEMQRIYEGSWVFLGLACQIPNPHDFFTTHIGRQPVIVTSIPAAIAARSYAIARRAMRSATPASITAGSMTVPAPAWT